MSQYVQYGYYTPYSPEERAVPPTGAPQPSGVAGQPIGPAGPVQGGQGGQPPQPTQQLQQPYQAHGGAPTVAPGPAPQPPAGGPPGPAQMDVAEGGSPAAPGGGPQAGPAAPQSTSGPQPASGGGGMPAEPPAQPLVDIMETPEEVVIIADVPGYVEEEITIQADDSTIVIVAERAEEERDDEYRVIRAERPRRLERLIQLPTTGNIDDASATHENGVCTVTIPKDGTDRREIGFH